MSVTVSMINMKGGVGKTTLTFNLAWYSAWRANLRVLAVDLDPQSNLSQYFMGAEKYLNYLNADKGTVVDIFEQFSAPKASKGSPTTIYHESGGSKGRGTFSRLARSYRPRRLQMTADEFLSEWISQHIKIGTPETDADRLAEELLFAASQNELDGNALEVAAGENLEDYLLASMRKAAERAQIGEARFQPQE